MNRWIVAVAAVVVQMCLGAVYAWSVFLKPLMVEFGWSRTEVSLTFTIFLVAYSLSMIFGGKWQDSAGPRRVATVGGILLGLGYILAGRTNTLWWLYLTYGLLGGVGVGLGYGSPISACLKWFPDKRGLATGLAVAGFGAGALIFAPLATRIIVVWGWRQAFVTLGITFLLVVVLGARFLIDPPSGWEPIGSKAATAGKKQGTIDFEWREMLTTRQFWMLWVMFSLSASSGLMVIGHLAAFAREAGLSAEVAALAVGVLAVLNGTGRIGWGAISDRMGRLQCLRLVFLVMCLAIFAFLYLSSALTLLIAAGTAGLGFGGILSLFPALTADYFGTKGVGANYGLLFTAYGIAGVVGPSLGARIYDATGSYYTAFIIMACLCLVAAGISVFAKPPKREM